MKISTILSLITATIFLLSAATSSAQGVSKKEALAGELLDFLHVEKTLDAVFAAMPKMEQQVLDAQKLPPEQKEEVRKTVRAKMDSLKKSLTWDAIRPMYVKIYADNFDEAELEGIIAYYKSPVGKIWLEKQPDIQAARIRMMSDIIAKIQTAASDATKNSNDRTDLKSMATP